MPSLITLFSPDGYLFDKEAILEYILKKKCENIKRMKEYEKQKKKEASDLVEEAEAEERSRSDQFVSDQKNILSKGTSPQSTASSISNMTQGREKELPSFWVPSQTPVSEKIVKSLLKEPDQTVYCPMSGRPLRSKDLFDVVFTPIDSQPDPATSSATKTVSCLCFMFDFTILRSRNVTCVLLPMMSWATLSHVRI